MAMSSLGGPRRASRISGARGAWCWLEPRLAADVSYSELIEDRLRDPVLRRRAASCPTE